mgnify:CR=1 FL=1
MVDNLSSLIFYIFIFITSAFFVGLNKKSYYYAWIGVSIIVILAAFRGPVGTDYFTYMNQFERIKISNWPSVINVSNLSNELLFLILMKITSYSSQVLFLGGAAVISLGTIYTVLNKQYVAINIGVAYLFYLLVYFPSSLNVIRQYIALSITLYSLKFVFEKNLGKYLFGVLIAFLFHKSAIVTLPIYLLWSKKNKAIITGYKLGIILSIILFVVLNYQMIINYFAAFDAFERYAVYSSVSDVGKNRDFYLRVFNFTTILALRKRLMAKDNRNGLFIVMLLISLLIGITGFWHPQVKRLSLYFELPLIILMGYIPSLFSKQYKLVVSLIIILYAIVYFVITYFILGSGNIFPYIFLAR